MAWTKKTNNNTVVTDLGELAPGLRVRIEAWKVEGEKADRGGLVINIHDAAKLAAGKDSSLISFGSTKAKVILTLGLKGMIAAFKALAAAEAAAAQAKAAAIQDATKAAIARNEARVQELEAKLAAAQAEKAA
jgi:hypothetical protein